jgi:hypothetical protein
MYQRCECLGRSAFLIFERLSSTSGVSALGGVHTLYLSYCTGISDASALGGVIVVGIG